MDLLKKMEEINETKKTFQAWKRRQELIEQRRRVYQQGKKNAMAFEKQRLQQERKNYIARKQYRQEMRVHNKQRQEKQICCPRKRLGRLKAPTDGAERMCLYLCQLCGQRTFCLFGGDENGRVGVYFRGEWFQDIDPISGEGTTFQGKRLSLTEH